MNPVTPNTVTDPLADPPEYVKNIIRNHDLCFDVCLPCEVISYDRTSNLVKVQPCINRVLTDGTEVERVPIVVPCHNPGGSNIGISYPLSAGDTGWVISSDRDTSLFLQEKKLKVETQDDRKLEVKPNTLRIHQFQFGVFVPDHIYGLDYNQSPESEHPESSGDDGCLLIETADGKTKIQFKNDYVSLKADGIRFTALATEDVYGGIYLRVEKPMSVHIYSDINIEGDVSITGDVSIYGDLFVGSDISSNGNISAVGDVLAGDVSLRNHKHSVDTPNGTTGSPIV